MEQGITKDAEQFINHRIQTGEDVDTAMWEATYCNGLVLLYETNRIQGMHRLWENLTLMGMFLKT